MQRGIDSGHGQEQKFAMLEVLSAVSPYRRESQPSLVRRVLSTADGASVCPAVSTVVARHKQRLC